MEQLVPDPGRRVVRKAELPFDVGEPLCLPRGSVLAPFLKRWAEGLGHLALNHDDDESIFGPHQGEDIVLRRALAAR